MLPQMKLGSGQASLYHPNESACSRESGALDPISLAGRLERHPLRWGDHDHESGLDLAWRLTGHGVIAFTSTPTPHQTPLGVLDCHDRYPGLQRLFRIPARSSA
jgi:hypothetical protein